MARKYQAIDRHVGARVRFARIERKLSQSVLGEELGISFQQVQKYELGKDRISAGQLLSIARLLNKEISFFFEDIRDGEEDGLDEAPLEPRIGKLPRATTAYDVKVIRMLHAIDDERIKMRLFGLMEAIVAARSLPEQAESGAAIDTHFEGHFRQ